MGRQQPNVANHCSKLSKSCNNRYYFIFKDIIESFQKIRSSRTGMSKNVYVPIGNFIFLDDIKSKTIAVAFHNQSRIQEQMDLCNKQYLNEQVPSQYNSLCIRSYRKK